jgi:putative membrane protein
MTTAFFAITWDSLGWSAIFGITGIILAIAGFKLFDLLTPGDLQKEIFDNKNVAAAILAGAFIVGICIVVAAAVGG